MKKRRKKRKRNQEIERNHTSAGAFASKSMVVCCGSIFSSFSFPFFFSFLCNKIISGVGYLLFLFLFFFCFLSYVTLRVCTNEISFLVSFTKKSYGPPYKEENDECLCFSLLINIPSFFSLVYTLPHHGIRRWRGGPQPPPT